MIIEMGESQRLSFSVLEILTCLLYNKIQNCEVSKIKINSKLILKLTALFAVICLALCSCSININVNGSDSESKTTVSEIGTLSVHYLDVGQGDSIFIELPNQKCMLIDAGENMYGKVLPNISIISDTQILIISLQLTLMPTISVQWLML